MNLKHISFCITYLWHISHTSVGGLVKGNQIWTHCQPCAIYQQNIIYEENCVEHGKCFTRPRYTCTTCSTIKQLVLWTQDLATKANKDVSVEKKQINLYFHKSIMHPFHFNSMNNHTAFCLLLHHHYHEKTLASHGYSNYNQCDILVSQSRGKVVVLTLGHDAVG